MHINSMPDLVLCLIFAKLSLQDLLIIGRVCTLWRSYQLEIGNQVRSLTLLIGSSSAHTLITNSCFTLKYRDLLLNDDGKRMYSSQHLHKRFHLTYCSFTSEDSVSLLNIFPHITTLEIAIKYVREQFVLTTMVPLLAQWSPVLKSLKMYFKYIGARSDYHKSFLGKKSNEFFNLFEVQFKSLQSLEHLTIDTDTMIIPILANSIYADYFQSTSPSGHLPTLTNSIDPPILVSLREFYFDSVDQLNIIEKFLLSYAVVNEKLTKISLYDSGFIFHYKSFPRLVSKIDYLVLYVTALNLSQVGDILPLFSSITKLLLFNDGIFFGTSKQLSIDALKSLSSLPHLTHLHVNNYIRDFFASPQNSLDLLPQLASVQVLTMTTKFKSTSNLESNHWAHLLPNVQVIEVNFLPKFRPVNVSRRSKPQLRMQLSTFAQCPELHHIFTRENDRIYYSEEDPVFEWIVLQVNDRKIILNVEE